MDEKNTEENFELEPVEIHPEYYEKNLFGEVVNVGGERPDISTDAQGLALRSREEFNIFALTDAIGARKKRDAWVIYQKALASGMVAEEVFYKLVWQIKTMLIAEKTKTVSETDMKPFPYNKAKSFLKNFRTSELQNLSKDLVLGYHKARRGEGEIETLVEKTLLKL